MMAQSGCYGLSRAAQLAVVIFNVPAALVVPQGGVFHLAIFLLAAGLERVAIYLNVRAGLGERAAWAVISVAVISIAITVAVVCVMMVVTAVAIVAVISIVAIISVVAITIVSAGATEIAVQVLDFSIATLVVRKLGTPPVAALILACGVQA